MCQKKFNVNQKNFTTYVFVKLFESSSGGRPRFFRLVDDDGDERSFGGELNGAKNGIALSIFSLLSYSLRSQLLTLPPFAPISLCRLWCVFDTDDAAEDDGVGSICGNEVFDSVTLLLLLSLFSVLSFSSSLHETSASPLILSSSAVFSSDAKLF